jgi:glycosyltransferase involved in cell wall biosynthesis
MTFKPPAVSRGLDLQHEKVDAAGKRIAILVVAYNAVATLAQVLQRIPDAIWQNVEEIAVFDDASHDATYELAVGYKTVARSSKVQIVRHERNLGYGGNQKAGYAYFIEKGFDVVVLLHADGQYAPEILHHLYHPIVAETADAVLGSRMTPDFEGPLKGGMPLYKYVGNRILSIFQNRALGMNLSEFHSGYRAYNLHALKEIAMDAMTDDFHFDTEIIIKLHHQGFRIKEVSIPTYYGNEICYVNGMKYALDVIRAVNRYKSTIRSARRHPEFAEYFINYPLKEGPTSSHGIVRRLIGRNERVLDVGCGEGYFASAIACEGTRIYGTDILPAPKRRGTFAEYACADLTEGLISATCALSEQKFEKILMMDVLQQLADPERILRESHALLAQNGRIVVSLPNVANVTVRLELLSGRFRYSDRGILDRRHLRFFTRSTASAMLGACGFEIERVRATTMPLEFVFDLPPSNAIMRFMSAILRFLTAAMPNVLGYQWVFVARRSETQTTD